MLHRFHQHPPDNPKTANPNTVIPAIPAIRVPTDIPSSSSSLFDEPPLFVPDLATPFLHLVLNTPDWRL